MPDRNEAGKVFVGGLSWDTTRDSLLAYFSQYGEVVDCVVMKNQQTGKSRGFGFVTYRDVSCVETVLSVPAHIVDGRQVDPKACNPKSLQRQGGGDHGPPQGGPPHGGPPHGPPQGPPPQGHRQFGGPGQNRGPRGGHDAFKHKKIFMGGLPNSVDEDFLKNFFAKYGRVIDVNIMYDQQAGRSRGFGFLTLETDEAVDQVCRERFININGRKVECKRAEPRSRPDEPKPEPVQIQLPGLPMTHIEMPGPPPQQAPVGPPEGQWPPPDGNWAPAGQVQSPPANPPPYQNVPFQGGYQEQPAGLQPAGWPPQQQPPQQGAGSWPPTGAPPAQQPAPGASAQFMAQPPSTQALYTSPQAQPPTAAPGGYQWTSPPAGQVAPAGQPPQAVAVAQTPPGAYGAYVPVSATQQTPAVAAPIRQYGEFPANGQPSVAPGSQLPVSVPQSFPGYPSPYGAQVTQAANTTPTDPYAQPAVVATQGAAIQIPGAQPQAVPGYGSPVTPAGAVSAVPDPASGTVKAADYASYYGTYGYTGDATAAAAAYGATPPAQNPYASPTEAPQAVAYGGAPGPSPTFPRQGTAAQTYHPYRR